MSLRPALEDLIALAREAGDEIMRVRAAGFKAQQKLDGTMVTEADQRAEALIEAGLARLAPGVPMIGEEAAAAGRAPKCGDAYYCVDPLDGTRGFAKGGDEFTVNIARIENGEAVAGVVFAPATGEVFAGEPGRALGARAGQPLQPIAAAAARPAQGWRLVASQDSGRTPETAAFIDAVGAGSLVHASSSIKFCRIAEGLADLYPRLGNVSEWDAAAGHAILRAAGGGVMELDGAPLRYGMRADNFIIPGFVAFANAEAAGAALSALKR